MPEEEWQAHQERMRRTLDRVDEINADLAESAGQRRMAGADERWRQHQRQEEAEWERLAHPQPEPAPPAPQAPARDWQAEERWIAGIVERKLSAYTDSVLVPVAKEFGEDLGGIDKQIADLQKRTATVDLLLQIETRLADLEGRAVMKPPPGPRLVGDAGA